MDASEQFQSLLSQGISLLATYVHLPPDTDPTFQSLLSQGISLLPSRILRLAPRGLGAAFQSLLSQGISLLCVYCLCARHDFRGVSIPS